METPSRGWHSKKQTARQQTRDREKKCGHTDTLQSLLKLKQGNSKKYSDLVMQKTDVTNNILTIRKQKDIEFGNNAGSEKVIKANKSTTVKNSMNICP